MYFAIVFIASFSFLKFLAYAEEDKETISFNKPGKEFILFTILSAAALTFSNYEPKWLLVLTVIYMTICAETDYKEHVVYRICHYFVIIASIYVFATTQTLSVWNFPFVYILILALAHFLKAYREGDTWMFLALGLFLMANGYDDIGLLLFWLYAIVIFLLMNITKIRYAPLDGQEKKTIRLTAAQPIGPAIFIALLLFIIK